MIRHYSWPCESLFWLFFFVVSQSWIALGATRGGIELQYNCSPTLLDTVGLGARKLVLSLQLQACHLSFQIYQRERKTWHITAVLQNVNFQNCLQLMTAMCAH